MRIAAGPLSSFEGLGAEHKVPCGVLGGMQALRDSSH